jgi:uncharacterized protein YutD|tara:strand:- start:445 stop:645 length:201 start_codon:yes stop_codon:yes gene_type:complete
MNKKELNKENIINIYNQGLSKLIYLVENQDILVFEDDFSEEVSDIILNYDYMVIDKKISQLIYELN